MVSSVYNAERLDIFETIPALGRISIIEIFNFTIGEYNLQVPRFGQCENEWLPSS